MSEQKLEYIFTNQIHEHPDNPRKSLGDLKELTDSIKENGVLQNLTVVAKPVPHTTPQQYTYTVIIGHSRLAAAREAGLAKVPCVVVDMDEKEQLRTMLMENIQRLYAIVASDPLAGEYLQCEMRFQLMMQDVFNILGEVMGMPPAE